MPSGACPAPKTASWPMTAPRHAPACGCLRARLSAAPVMGVILTLLAVPLRNRGDPTFDVDGVRAMLFAGRQSSTPMVAKSRWPDSRGRSVIQ